MVGFFFLLKIKTAYMNVLNTNCTWIQQSEHGYYNIYEDKCHSWYFVFNITDVYILKKMFRNDWNSIWS